MSKFTVLIFPDETAAYEGTHALKELHAEGSITLYGSAVIAKDAAGAVSIKDAAINGASGTAVGALAGVLVGLVAGPVGAVLGLAGGALIGSLSDLFNAGVSSKFIQNISDELSPGKTAVIAEIAEDWVTPLNTRIEALGGVIIRTPRSDVEETRIEEEIAAGRAELEHLRAEYAQAGDAAKTALASQLNTARANLEATVQRAKEKAEAVKAEAQARIDTLQKQANAARSDSKARIDQRIATLRADYKQRAAKLEKAWQLASEALS
jgi:uncharacterized membrane protein